MDERLNRWEVLFQRALILIDSVRKIGIPVDWTFGGGTVLMRRHRHRFSKDIDIFINDPQFLGYLSPRLSPTAESLTTKYIEDHNSRAAVVISGSGPEVTHDADHFSRRDRSKAIQRLVRRLNDLGCEVQLRPQAA
jgi:hypothetical protein